MEIEFKVTSTTAHTMLSIAWAGLAKLKDEYPKDEAERIRGCLLEAQEIVDRADKESADAAEVTG